MIEALMAWKRSAAAEHAVVRIWHVQPITLDGGTPAVHITVTQRRYYFEGKGTITLTEEFIADAGVDTINRLVREELDAIVQRWAADDKWVNVNIEGKTT